MLYVADIAVLSIVIIIQWPAVFNLISWFGWLFVIQRHAFLLFMSWFLCYFDIKGPMLQFSDVKFVVCLLLHKDSPQSINVTIKPWSLNKCWLKTNIFYRQVSPLIR